MHNKQKLVFIKTKSKSRKKSMFIDKLNYNSCRLAYTIIRTLSILPEPNISYFNTFPLINFKNGNFDAVNIRCIFRELRETRTVYLLRY